jgi:hypothetical protein
MISGLKKLSKLKYGEMMELVWKDKDRVICKIGEI